MISFNDRKAIWQFRAARQVYSRPVCVGLSVESNDWRSNVCGLWAMVTYIRFQTTLRCPSTGTRLGVFRAARQLQDDFDLTDEELETLRKSLGWFNDYLRVPRLRGKKTRDVFWFRSTAQEMIDRIWDIVAIFQSAGLHVEKHRTDSPGAIVYSDEQQIAAIPRRTPRRIKVHVLRG